MLFRIEDSENSNGQHREYSIRKERLPQLKLAELEGYLAEEIRKEVNNSKNRRLLSYSKSLGVCLLKYNKYADNELHINKCEAYNFVYYDDVKANKSKCKPFSLLCGLDDIKIKHKKREILLLNFKIDVSNNNLLDSYLRKNTGMGRKKMASPEKDKEVLLMQSPEDMVISTYSDSVYLLYALYLKYGMDESIYINITNMIYNLEDFRFEFCGERERYALLEIVSYLYINGIYEKEMSDRLLQDSQSSEQMSIYYDSILQLHGIQNESFEDSYMLRDYNDNVISDWIWHFYAEKHM
ncbi:hypothetical protein [Paenibacillus luteus]|uniref:hypothetical protein n=1 Tax=Paenibacillus luteus TaxID=2545753 RepID=UPI0011433CCC|nr:hypothetical protein [Paenibacillus luteus]